MIRHILVLVFALTACRGASPGHGILRDPSGHPVGAGIAVTMTDATTGEAFPPVYTDQAGQFAFSLPAGTYIIATTTPTQFAYVEDIQLPGSPVITLTADCHRVAGQVTGALASPTVLSFSRFSRKVGDRFSTSIDGHGRGEVCLPRGAYEADTLGALAALPVWIRVPEATAVSIPAFPTAEVQAVPSGLRLHSDDLSTFARALDGVALIGMGEANHGTAEFYSYRGKLSLELARTGKLRALLFEADVVAMLEVEDYVMGARPTLGTALVDVGFWITDVYEFIAVLDDIRAYNAAAAPADKLHVLGIDAQYIAKPSGFLLGHRGELAISDREASLIKQLIPDNGKAFTTMADGDRAAIGALVDRLTLPDRPTDLAVIATRADLAARSLRLQLGYFSKAGSLALRDPAMADLTQHLFALTGAKQAAVWAHNGHVSRIGRDGAKSLGECLAERFGARYYPIAFMSYRGTARAWDSANKIGVIPHALPATPAYNIESVIMQATGTPPAAWVRFDQPDQAWQRWLSRPRYSREFGWLFNVDGMQQLDVFPDDFSAVVVLDHTTPTTPTPTGVRKIP
jgi:erythromycin esterase